MAAARFSRLEGLHDLDALSRERVVVAGLGSGGSTVALELAKAGVGRLLLIDPDELELQNVIRHECDDRYLGQNKAEAVGHLVRRRNPDAEVECLAADVHDLGGRLEAAVAGAALVAGCTDSEAPKHLLNRLCLASGTAAVYAGVYERGVGGEVIRCAGGETGACYACVTSVLKGSAPVAAAGEVLDYGAIDEHGTIHGAPGLGLDVRLIALLHAKLCLLTLLGAAPDANVLLFGTTRVEGLFPRAFASALVDVAPQQGCLACTPYRRAFCA